MAWGRGRGRKSTPSIQGIAAVIANGPGEPIISCCARLCVPGVPHHVVSPSPQPGPPGAAAPPARVGQQSGGEEEGLEATSPGPEVIAEQEGESHVQLDTREDHWPLVKKLSAQSYSQGSTKET